jgi:hypothetical protein
MIGEGWGKLRALRSRWVVCVGFGALLALPVIAVLLAAPATTP